MRFTELHLLRFGHFEDLRLAFASAEPGFHLIFGANEAGKSTALRAITGLLYGIPDRSTDTHTHGPDLRLGATLVQGNAQAQFVRRKGRKNTLLDPAGQPLAEDQLQAFLHGIPESTFRSLYGLDHEGLRRGAEALLHDGGHVGESLFEAGVGSTGIAALLGGLRDDARAIFVARGHKRPLNEALERYRVAQRRLTEDAVRVDAYRAQEQGIEESRAEENRLRAQRRQLSEERARLQRAVAVLPLLARRNGLLSDLQALGDVPRLPEDAPLQREQGQLALARSEPELDQRREQQRRLQQALAGIRVSEQLLALDPQLIEALRDRLGTHRQSLKELPAGRARLRSLQAEAQNLLRRLRLPEKLSEAEALRLGSGERTHIRGLAQGQGSLLQAMERGDTQLDRQRQLLQGWEREAAELHEVTVDGGLQQLVTRARQVAERAEQQAQRQTELQLAQERLAAVAGTLVPHFVGGQIPAEPGKMPLPETGRYHQESLHHAEQAVAAADQTLHRLADNARQLAVELDALGRQGEVPTEAMLQEQRQRRDAHMATGLAVDQGERGSWLTTLRELVGHADRVADRLRRETERTTRLARLLAEQQDVALRKRDAEAAVSGCKQALVECQGAFVAFLAEHGLSDALRPDEALAVVERWGTQYEPCRLALREAEAWLDALAVESDAVCKSLCACLGVASGASGDLGSLLSEAEQRLARQVQAREERAVLLRQIRDGRAELVRLEAEHQGNCNALQKWQAQWKHAMTLLRMSENTSVDQAQGTLDDLTELFSKLDEVGRLREQLEQANQEQDAFKKDVFRLRDRYLFQLGAEASPDVEDVAEELIRAHEQARKDAAERARLQRELTAQAQAIEALELACTQARNVLAQLCSQARVATPEELQAAEQRATEAGRLARDIDGVTQDILGVAEGASLEAVSEEVAGVRVEVAKGRIADIDGSLDGLEQALSQVTRDVVAKEKGLEQMRANGGAADAALEMSAAGQACQAHARHHIRLRLAEVLLEREVRRYRERHQGPVLQRAGDLFARLTCGRFSGVSADFDVTDVPVLRCHRADGRAVGIEALSDGSRDPLFLALRLATLERYGTDRLPLCLDDLLIHLDDGRAAAALGVLHEFAAHTQVLFFTHHEHLRTLARQVLDQGLYEHVLPGPSAVTRGAEMTP